MDRLITKTTDRTNCIKNIVKKPESSVCDNSIDFSSQMNTTLILYLFKPLFPEPKG